MAVSFSDISFQNDNVLIEEHSTPFDNISKEVAFGTIKSISCALVFPNEGNIVMYRTEGRIQLIIDDVSYYLIESGKIVLKYT